MQTSTEWQVSGFGPHFAAEQGGVCALTGMDFAAGAQVRHATVNGRGAYHQSINALAYTASLGSGFTATVALEDTTERDVGIASYTPYAPGFGGFAPFSKI
jgi:hypothetical protein